MSPASHHDASMTARLIRKPEFWIALLVFLSGAYFCGSGAWNQNARLDAIFAFVEPGPDHLTFRIDHFVPLPKRFINTGDYARFGDQYYANKAPGTILLGVLGYLPLYGLEHFAGANIDEPVIEILNAYLINLWVSVVPMTVAVVLFYRLLWRRLSAPRAAALALLTWFGTALFPYATQLWGHSTTAAFVMMALFWLDRALETGAPRAATAAGACLGLGLLCDYLVLPLVAAVVLAVGLSRPRNLIRLGLGGSIPASLLLGYHWYCFGGPFVLPTHGSHPVFVDKARLFGVFGVVSPRALFELTLGTSRGLFLQMPLLVVALLGLVLWGRRNRRDLLLWIIVLASVATLLEVASFNGWHGGATVCARYLIPTIPLLMLGLRELPKSRWATVTLFTCAVPSLFHMLALAAVSPIVPDKMRAPLYREIIPRLLLGDLHPYPFPIRLQLLHPEFVLWQRITVWNWGDVLGLSGASRLLPLVAIVGAGSAALWWATQRTAHD
jgi:hypothetical protein